MLAGYLRFAILVMLLTMLGCGLLGIWAGLPIIGSVAAVVLLFGYSFVLAIELVCFACVGAPDAKPKIGALIQAWWGETVITPRVFWWHQPFKSLAQADYLPANEKRNRGILLIHGLVCNRGFWNPWMFRLRQLGIPFVALNLEPVFGRIEGYADAIESAVRRLDVATGIAPVVVAHSMGGLAVRCWLGRPAHDIRIHHVVTVGTPHQGTWMARFARSASGQQMVIGSKWLQELARSTTMAQAREFTCYYGDCDNVVFPCANAKLLGADNRLIARTAHVAMAFEEEVFMEVLRWQSSPADQSSRSVDKRSPGPTSPSCDTLA